MDVDDKPNSRRTVDPGPSRKRKRQPTTSTATRASSKAPATKLAKSLATPTTTRRPAKRLRSVTSSSRGLAADATRVFALWKNDSHYYSGVVHSLKSGSSTLYHVKFDDGTEGDVEIRQLRQAILVVGDEVILINGDLRGKVTEDKLESDGVVVVEVDDGDELDHLEVGLSEVRIAGRTLLKQWKDRLLHADSIITQVQPKPLKGTPSPSKMSMVSGTSATKTSKCRFFSKTGLVVTLSPGNRDWDQVKGDIEKSINSHGGTVIDDWSSVISIRGKHSQSNKRWVVEKDDVRWSGREGIERVFLLSDEANSKPKYLIALALGVPCLSTDWLRACLQEGEKDWQPYLLPAGFSEPLNARVSQMVDLDWGNSFEHVREIMANPVAAKLLSDLSVLCLSPDFVPLATTKTSKRSSSDADKAKEASRTIPLIVLAMGASRVEAVTEAKFASQDLSSYDYVVVKELGDINKIGNDGVTCVHLSWVKDCLMVGRLLPRPE
ncbi:hypothetical protein JAAARDRAFT_125032 [Jaapia argillacea MUCL 33604]|uniref:BRCT domain-containing protein n=1 Tax=Jaapia argillacea MUCL 33604 TaxID=933084 RepID=A0A067QEG8_9AGAM|nr:hypothetical protein JAAARDRAFT_125032 [Jaapia argillacea MUCL 33604]